MNRGGVTIRPLTAVFVFATIVVGVLFFQACTRGTSEKNITAEAQNTSAQAENTSAVTPSSLFTPRQVWTAPDTATIPQDEHGQLITYGRRLMIHTSKYFGPHGTLSQSTNGLNCQNCHLDAGTRPYGNNLAVTAATYPKFLPRCGEVLSIAQKINECFLRSLNGAAIDTNSHEMQAYLAYIKWLGKDVKHGHTPAGTGGIHALPFLTRAADPEQGRLVYEQYCVRCHGQQGAGQLAADVLSDPAKQQGGTATAEDLYYYPPVWGSSSYNAIATLYRVSKLAGFVKYNMPYPANYLNPMLTDEQAWDVAAYVNSRQRPIKDFSNDYTCDLTKKPFDFPFPPYADTLSEAQHKFGPYPQMASAHTKAH